MTSLPKHLLPSVLSLCVVQCIEIALITHIFPFIAAFLLSLDVPPKEVATYSGLAESLVSFGDLVCLPIHVKLVQWFPHRTLIVISLVLSSCVAALMGFCSHVWQLLLLRSLTAAFSFGGFLSNIALGEVVKSESGGQAFSLFASATFLGAMLGSLIGGYLAQPADRVWIIGKLPLFATRPYIVPGLLLGCLTLGCALGVWLFVPETHPAYITSVTVSNLENPDISVVPEATRCLEFDVEPEERGSDSMSKTIHQTLWKEPHFWYLNIVDIVHKACFFSCLTLMSTAGKIASSLGGLDLEVAKIGEILFLTPLLTSINLVFLFPAYSEKVSDRWIVGISSSAWILTALFFPTATQLGSGHTLGHAPTYALWYLGHMIGMTWWALRGSLTNTMYPDPRVRAVVTGILEQSGNLGCLLGVTGSSRLFALSSTYSSSTFGRQIVWIYLAGLSIVTAAAGWCWPRTRPGSVTAGSEEHIEHIEEDENTPLIGSQSRQGRS